MSYTRLIIIFLLVMIITPIVATGCSTGTARVINESIDTQSAYKLIQANSDNPDFVIIDIRTEPEFNSGHIADAVMIDYYLPDFQQKLGTLDHSKKYLIYCRTANRTSTALKIMKSLGFRETYELAGGITKWKAAGLPTVN